jgi:phospholipid/cholesterol/gamma-HCH transport system ATP-binding protein
MTARRHKKDDVILSARGIVNRFGRQTVHDGISLDIKRGEIVGIAGGSGSGKSVLLKTLIGLRTPDKGEVKITGKPVADITPAESASILGVLFQEGALFSALTVAQNIMLPLREHTNLNPEQQKALAGFKLALVGMPPDSGQKYPSELSGGMTRRAALARALAMDPLILFLDEPTSGLDPINASGFDELIRELNESLGVTVVMVTHDLDTLFGICDRAIVLVDGKAVTGTLPELLKNDQPWIKEFFNGPRGQGARIAAERAYGNG